MGGRAAAADVHPGDHATVRGEHHGRAGQVAVADRAVVADPNAGTSVSALRGPGCPSAASVPRHAPPNGCRVATSLAIVAHPSCRACSGRRWDGLQEVPGGGDVGAGAGHDVRHLDELVGLMGDPLAARPVDDGRQAGVPGQDGAVGGARHSAEYGAILAGRGRCPASIDRTTGRIQRGVHRRPVVQDRRPRPQVLFRRDALAPSRVIRSISAGWSTRAGCGRRGPARRWPG